MKKYCVAIRTQWGTLGIDDVEAVSENEAEDKAFEMAVEAINTGSIDQIEEL